MSHIEDAETEPCWPEHYPAECPPQESRPASGRLYRALKQPAPNPEDFKSHRELHPDEKLGANLRCRACGLSVFADRDRLVKACRTLPTLRDSRAFAILELSPIHGKMMLTENRIPSHTTWWAPIGCDRLAAIVAVDPLDEGALA